MIILKKVTKIYGSGDEAVIALKNVNLVIEDDIFTAVFSCGISLICVSKKRFDS